MERPRNAGRAAASPRGLTALAVAVGLAVAVAGCALPTPVASGKNWKIAPSYRVTHTGLGADQGYMTLARQYEGERRWREARDAWRKAAVEAPNDADILNALGMAEVSQGMYADSVAALRRAVAAAPDRVALRNNLGYALLLDGREDEAKSVLRDALERDPQHRLARANLDSIGQVAAAAVSSADKTAGIAAVDSGSVRRPVAGSVQTTPNLAPLQLRQTGSAVAPAAPAVADVAEVAVVAAVVDVVDAVDAAAVVALVAAAGSVVTGARAGVQPRIEIANGNGSVGMAGRLRAWLGSQGVVGRVVLSNALPYNTATTVVRYRPGFVTTAQDVAQSTLQHMEIAPAPGGALGADVRVVLGRDRL